MYSLTMARAHPYGTSVYVTCHSVRDLLRHVLEDYGLGELQLAEQLRMKCIHSPTTIISYQTRPFEFQPIAGA
jgi:hypothetical protein